MGVGGKIAVILLIALAVTEAASILTQPVFRITDNYQKLVIVAAIIAAVGFSLNLAAAFTMLSAHKKDKLATGGLYAVFLNPMYTLQIFITVPGVLLFFNSWLVLVSIVPVFAAFKIFSKEEENYLLEKFGDTFISYKKTVLFKCL